MGAAASMLIATLAFHADASEYANAVYNVVCLAQQVTCTREKYDRLWKDELRWSQEDQAQLDRWRSIVRAAETRAQAPPAAPLLANYQSFYPALRQRLSILSAALDAKSASAFQTRASRVVAVDEAAALARALRHFQTRLRPWWQRVGRKRVSGLNVTARRLSPALRNLLDQVASFVHADPDIADVYMHVVPSPDVGDDSASGTVIRNHFFMELVPPSGSDDTAKEQAAKMVVGVAIHELTHALYDSAPVATHLALMRQFVAVPDHSGPSMYAFSNEAIATAVTALAADLENDDDTDYGGEYRHPYIPRLGRAATEPLKRALASGTTMTDRFVDEYVGAGREALGPDADSLSFKFSAVAIVASDSIRPAVASFRETIAPTYGTDSRASWQRVGELSAAFLLDYDEVREFADRIPDLTGLMKYRGFAFILPYKTRSRILVLSGRDAAATSDVIKQLQPSKPVPEDGLVFTID
jgi:hypothetical protein